MALATLLVRWFSVGLVLLVAQAAAAQDAGSFDRGRTIRLIVGGRRGSDADIYARLIAKYLGRHIGGHPAVAVADMPGNGGHVAAGYIYSAAPKDGTAIGTVPAAVLTAPLWFGFGTVPHDPTQFLYLGSAASESTDCFVGGDTPIGNFRDAFAREVTMGATAGDGPTRDGPLLLNAMLGTRFRVIAKYAGTRDILAAINNGAVMGACGLTWSSVATRHPHWLPKGVLRGLVQESVAGSPLAARLGIPLAVSYAGSAADAETLALAYAQQAFGKPFFLPPGTPPGTTEALRAAFMDTLHDAGLLADAKAASLAIDPVSGPSVRAQIAKLYATPAQTLDRVRAVFGGAQVR